MENKFFPSEIIYLPTYTTVVLQGHWTVSKYNFMPANFNMSYYLLVLSLFLKERQSEKSGQIFFVGHYKFTLQTW